MCECDVETLGRAECHTHPTRNRELSVGVVSVSLVTYEYQSDSHLDVPSKSQLKRAGDRLRKRASNRDPGCDGEQLAEDALLVKRWRSAHTGALTTTRIGLGAITMRVLGRDSQAGLVTQRLKRYESILAKLVRDRPRLGEIEDIAGCRAVLPDASRFAKVHASLEGAKKLDIERIRDYCKTPHPGGYRALHLWCRRDGFKIEVQLRTLLQQRWAASVEEFDSVLGIDLKHEEGPPELLEYFRELANYYSHRDNGVADSDIDTSALGNATAVVRDWLLKEVDHGRS